MPQDALDGALAHGAGLLIALEAARAVDAADLMAVGAVHEYGAPGLVHAHHALLLLRLRLLLRRRSPRLILPLLPLLLLEPVLPRLAPTFLLFFLVHHEQRVLRARVFRGTLATGRAAAVVHVVDERAGAASPGRPMAPRLRLLLLLERRRGRGRDGGGGGGEGGEGGEGGGQHSRARELLR